MKKNARRKCKYLIISSSQKKIHGVFNPDKDGAIKAEKYLAELRKKYPNDKYHLNPVSNLNKFLSSKI